MVRKASDKTLWAMSVNQIEDRIDRLQKEAGAVFRLIKKYKPRKKTMSNEYKNLLRRQDKISKELKRTTDIAKITRHHTKIKKQRRKLRKRRKT